MMRSQTALWGKSESLSKCLSKTLYSPSVRCVPVQVSTSTTPRAHRGSAENISSALLACLLFPHKHMTVYRIRCGRIVLRQRRGCCVKTWLRLIFVLKVHQLCSDVWIDSLKVNACSLAKSKSTRRKSRSVEPFHRVRLTDGTEPGEGAVSAGYLAPSANPSAPASGGDISKPGPDSSEEWKPFIRCMASASLGCGRKKVKWKWLQMYSSLQLHLNEFKYYWKCFTNYIQLLTKLLLRSLWSV